LPVYDDRPLVFRAPLVGPDAFLVFKCDLCGAFADSSHACEVAEELPHGAWLAV